MRGWLDTWHPGLSGLGFAYPALLLGAPHLALEVVFVAAALGAQLRAARLRSPAWGLGAGLATLLLAWIRPYTVPVVLLAAAVTLGPAVLARGPGASRRGRAVALLTLALATAPVLPHLRHLYRVLNWNTVFRGLDVVHPSPPVHEQLLYFGLAAAAAPALLLPAVRRRRRAAGLALSLIHI